MSILDRVSKAVGDVVDRGKKEVDQFMRIQKINGQIGDFEKTIGEYKGQVQQSKLNIGEMAIAMLRAGTLDSPEMEALLDQITGVEQQIASAEAEIAKKRAEIAENKFLDVRKEPGPVKFHEFAKEYLQWAKANKKPTTYQTDLYTMRIFDKEFEGKNIQDITTWQVEKY